MADTEWPECYRLFERLAKEFPHTPKPTPSDQQLRVIMGPGRHVLGKTRSAWVRLDVRDKMPGEGTWEIAIGNIYEVTVGEDGRRFDAHAVHAYCGPAGPCEYRFRTYTEARDFLRRVNA